MFRDTRRAADYTAGPRSAGPKGSYTAKQRAGISNTRGYLVFLFRAMACGTFLRVVTRQQHICQQAFQNNFTC